jgi:hypothetical protein
MSKNKKQLQKEVADKIGWNEATVMELGPHGIDFLIAMIERHETAERRLTDNSEKQVVSIN